MRNFMDKFLPLFLLFINVHAFKSASTPSLDGSYKGQISLVNAVPEDYQGQPKDKSPAEMFAPRSLVEIRKPGTQPKLVSGGSKQEAV